MENNKSLPNEDLEQVSGGYTSEKKKRLSGRAVSVLRKHQSLFGHGMGDYSRRQQTDLGSLPVRSLR